MRYPLLINPSNTVVFVKTVVLLCLPPETPRKIFNSINIPLIELSQRLTLYFFDVNFQRRKLAISFNELIL